MKQRFVVIRTKRGVCPMATNGIPPISIELPLYRKPSGNLRTFIETANKTQVFCGGSFQYESGFRVLRFTAKLEEDSKKAKAFLEETSKRSASYRPVPPDKQHCFKLSFFERQAGIFASKFSAGMAYSQMEGGKFSMTLIEKEKLSNDEQCQLIEDYAENRYGKIKNLDKMLETYEEEVFGILRVIFYYEKRPTRDIVANFFTLFDLR